MLVPCGGCTACLLERARQHAVRCMHEREYHDRACFVTLTYDEEHLPYAGSLVKEHFREFIRCLRREVKEPIRFFGCGEYGARWGRPHYHALLFGCDFVADRFVSGRRDGHEVFRSPTLERVWALGRSEIGSATFESAAYVARYVAKKLGGSALAGREPEFLLMSLKPGIGIPWIREHYREVFARDSVIVNGVEQAVPRMYYKWLQKYKPTLFRMVRHERRKLERPDELSHRAVVIDEVLKAKLNRFSREVEV